MINMRIASAFKRVARITKFTQQIKLDQFLLVVRVKAHCKQKFKKKF